MPSSIILAAVFGDVIMAAAALGATGMAVASFAINIVASMIISKAFAPNVDNAAINAAQILAIANKCHPLARTNCQCCTARATLAAW